MLSPAPGSSGSASSVSDVLVVKSARKRSASISLRLILMIAAGVVGVIIVGIFAFIQSSNFSSTVDNLNESNRGYVAEVDNINVKQLESRVAMAQAAAATSMASRTIWVNRMNDLDAEVAASIAELDRIGSTSFPAFADFLAKYNSFIEIRDTKLTPELMFCLLLMSMWLHWFRS